MNLNEQNNNIDDLFPQIEETKKTKGNSSFGKFLLGTVKLAIAIIIVLLVIGGIAAAIGGFIYHRKKLHNAYLAEPKKWKEISVPYLQKAKFTLVTKWQDYQLYYIFRMDGLPSKIKKELNKTRFEGNQNTGFYINLLDRSGFKITSIHISLYSMTRLIGEDGICTGLVINSWQYMSSEKYREVEDWEIMWNL